MKLKSLSTIGIIIIITGLIFIAVSTERYYHWKSREQYWEDQADYWHDREAYWENYFEALGNAVEADRKASDCTWGYLVGAVLIPLGIVILIVQRYKNKELEYMQHLERLQKKGSIVDGEVGPPEYPNP